MRFHLEHVSHYEFFEQLEKYKIEILSLQPEGENDIEETVNEYITKISNYIAVQLHPYPAEILDLLNSYHSSIDDFYSLNTESEKKIKRLNKNLKIVIGYLSIIDSLADPDVEIFIDGINEKTDFVLRKLHTLFGDEFFSIELLLKFNDLIYREGETREIADDLKRRGYIIFKEEYREYSDSVKISVKGAAYIERKQKQKTKKKSGKVLDQKIDYIIEHLTKLGFGQEILFEEMEELKTLQNKLSKKSWSQLLRGKLFDLTIEKVINAETANFVCEYLTNGSFKLLS